MNIIVRFDDELMRQYAERGAPVIFGITWEHENTYYPTEGWIDFGTVILGWWCTNVEKLWEGAEEAEFFFMEGPHHPKASFNRSTGVLRLTAKDLKGPWSVRLTDFTHNLIQAVNEVRAKLDRMNIKEREVASLGIWNSKLQLYLDAGEEPT